MALVLAHEVYHAILRTPEHIAHGIAKTSLTPSDLFGGPIGFAPDQMKRIEEALASAADSHNRLTVQGNRPVVVLANLTANPQ